MTNPSPKQVELSPSERRKARQRRTQKVLKYLKILGLPTSGGGVAGTIILFKNGQPELAIATALVSILALILAIGGGFVKELIEQVLDKIEEKLEARAEPLATLIVDGLENAVEGVWWKLTSQFQGKYYQNLIYRYRTYRTKGLKTPGAFTPDLDKVFVSLRVVSKSPSVISSALIQQQEASRTLKIWDFLAQSRKESAYRHIVVIAPPGAGKTTLLEHITLTYAQRKQRRQAPKLIPILLYLREIREEITTFQTPSLADLIRQQLRSQHPSLRLDPPPKFFADKLNNGQCLVMLDGLDEVADETQRQQVSHWVDKQMQTYPETTFILTSRPFGYENAPLKEAEVVLEVQSFNLKEMETFLRSWYLQNEMKRQARKEDGGVTAEAEQKADDLIGRIKNYPPLAAMALNPLLLTMIATVHDNRGALPGNRGELYAEICEVLLVRRQDAKGVEDIIPLKVGQKQSILQVLALELMARETRTFTLGEGKQIIQNQLLAVASQEVTPGQFLEHVENISGLLVEKGVDTYEFAHLSFQEYLAAAQVKETHQESLLLNKMDNSWWHETIRLYAAGSDTTPFLQAAIQNPCVASLTLAYNCLKEGKSANPAVREQLERFSLESSDPVIAKLAAEVKLARRLNQLLRIDERLKIDQDYITYGEYQLFVDETLKTGKGFPTGSADKPVTGISWENALGFCAWLTSKVFRENQEGCYYRLSTPSEEQQYLTQRPLGRIRLVKEQLSAEYKKLVQYLGEEEWEKADQETTAIMLKAVNRSELDVTSLETFSSEALSILDRLWLHYSQGKFGFGMQTSIWENMGRQRGTNDKYFYRTLGWDYTGESLFMNIPVKTFPGHFPQFWFFNASLEKSEIFPALAQRFIDCGIERSLPMFVFEGVTVNQKGEEIKREPSSTHYFTEQLGNGVGLDLVMIPEGEFWMGSPAKERVSSNNEKPQHLVNIQPFWMGKYPVTQAQWRRVAALTLVNRQLEPSPSKFKGDNRPVEQVSWDEAVEFCSRLSQHTGKQYRLPSEAEWEYACRSVISQQLSVNSGKRYPPFHFGETITADVANYDGSYIYLSEPKGEYRNKTTPIGNFLPNAFGLYDMHGNVSEWCADEWHENYQGAPIDGSVWKNGNDNRSPVRGGSWYNIPGYCRCAYRYDSNRDDRYDDVGFRVCCSVPRTLS